MHRLAHFLLFIILLSSYNLCSAIVVSQAQYKICKKAQSIAQQSFTILLSGEIHHFRKTFNNFKKLQHKCNINYSGEFGDIDQELFVQAAQYWHKHTKKELTNLIHHRIFVLAIKNVDLNLPYKPNIPIKESISKADFIRFKETFDIVKMLYFFFSEGKILIDFEVHPLNATLQKVYTQNYKTFKQNIIDINSITPYPGKLLFDKINSFDTLLVTFPSKKIPRSSTTMALNIPFIPNKLEAKVFREVLYIGNQRTTPYTIIHEVFHIFEHVFKIKPAHLFDQSQQETWPQWYHGEGQLYYYQQQFKKLILSKKLNKVVFRHRKRQIKFLEFKKQLK